MRWGASFRDKHEVTRIDLRQLDQGIGGAREGGAQTRVSATGDFGDAKVIRKSGEAP
jgi:hypothetical protein